MRVAECGTTCFTEFLWWKSSNMPGRLQGTTAIGQSSYPNSGVAISTCSGMVGSHSCKTA